MRRVIAAAALIVLVATNAVPCITVYTTPREYFHDAVRIVRAKATSSYEFHVIKSYRGDDKPGDDIAVFFDFLACGAPSVKEGEEYFVVEWKDRDRAGARKVDAENTAFLESHAKPVTRGEIIDVLHDWKNGKRSTTNIRKWIETATARDVDDWSDDNMSLASRFLDRFGQDLKNPELAQLKESCLQKMFAPHTDEIVLLLRMPVAQTDLSEDLLEDALESIGDGAVPTECIPLTQ